MDEGVKDVMLEILGDEDYDLVMRMLAAMEDAPRNPKDKVKEILEASIDG